MREKVGDTTVWEECRTALGGAILEKQGEHVVGPEWVVLKPSATPRAGFSASASAWTKTLRLARGKLIERGYEVTQIEPRDGKSVLESSLIDSVAILYGRITVRRDKR